MCAPNDGPRAQFGEVDSASLEEYKQLVEERRFVMTRYMQAVGLYLALFGFALRELASAQSAQVIWLLAGLLTLLNALALYAARQFRSMAMARESVLAGQFHMQKPHSLLWGYRCGLILVILFQVMVVAILAVKILIR